MNTIDVAASKRIAQDIQAEMKQCWKNAALAVMSLDELQKGFYVEGYCVLDIGVPIEHGWIEILRDGETVIIDPTLVLTDTCNSTYIAGVRYNHKQTMALLNKTLPRVYKDGHGGMSNPAYRACMAAAYSTHFPEAAASLSS